MLNEASPGLKENKNYNAVIYTQLAFCRPDRIHVGPMTVQYSFKQNFNWVVNQHFEKSEKMAVEGRWLLLRCLL